jgi:hypothetical protein
MEIAKERSPEEIANLKEQWLRDGTWDIEDTDGFAAHYDELLEFRLSWERAWAEEDRERHQRYKEGIPYDVAFQIMNTGRPIEKLALAHAYAVREQTEVQKRIAAALEKATEVKPWAR